MLAHIICGSTIRCGFRVTDDYFRLKTRFAPGICPRCNAPIHIVEPYTETIIPGARMLLQGTTAGQIVGLPVLSLPDSLAMDS